MDYRDNPHSPSKRGQPWKPIRGQLPAPVDRYFKERNDTLKYHVKNLTDKLPDADDIERDLETIGRDLRDGFVAGVRRTRDGIGDLAARARGRFDSAPIPIVTDQGTRPYAGDDLPSSFTGVAFNSAGSVDYSGTRTGSALRGTYVGDAPGTFVGVINRSGIVNGRYTEGVERGTFTGIADPKLEHVYGHSNCTTNCD